MSMGIQRQTTREVERMQSRAIIAKLSEDARALLTNTALEHVGALTALEQHLITIAPLGEARYREIVDSYTLGASAAIRRWV
jgi:DNA-binding TFAR19-related protein (PDSD5 family)